MPKLFGIDIQGIVAREVGPGLLDLTLITKKKGTRISGSLTSGPSVSTSTSAGKGMIDDYTDREVDGTLVKVGDRKILVIGGSLPSSVIPSTGDKITIESKEYEVVRVKRDPAAATYTCQAR